jgi:hypothetical protein
MACDAMSSESKENDVRILLDCSPADATDKGACVGRVDVMSCANEAAMSTSSVHKTIILRGPSSPSITFSVSFPRHYNLLAIIARRFCFAIHRSFGDNSSALVVLLP